MHYDVAIIGGGAAGLCAAVRLKQNNPALKVAILEQLPRIGKKLITTGNGRCNITNKSIELSRYHGEDVSFCEYALKKYTNHTAESFFKKLGIIFVYDEVGRAYPYSLQASSVVDALRFALEELQVDIFTETAVTDIEKRKNLYTVKSQSLTLDCRFVILAAGLYSGGEKIGSNGSVLRLFKQKGYKTIKTTPAIVQLKTDPAAVRALKGMKVNATARLTDGKTVLREEYGEVLFCDYGLSGPPVLQLSRNAERISKRLFISLDIMPEYTANQLEQIIAERINDLKHRTLEEFFTGMLNKRVGQSVLKECGFSLSQSVKELKTSDARAFAEKIKDWRFEIKGTTGFINSQVTAGGLATECFDPQTMMSKKDKNLFAIGEILDIDGDCGGFNLQWAWSSSLLAADAICKIKETEF